MSPFDVRLALRTVAALGVGLGVAYAVDAIAHIGAAGTDGAALGVVPLVPVIAALAVVAALAPSRVAGEERAMAALGISPPRFAAASIGVAIVASTIAAIVVASTTIDIEPLFPIDSRTRVWRVAVHPGAGAVFEAPSRGLVLDGAGTLAFVDGAVRTRALRPERRWSGDARRRATAWTLLFAGVALALFAAGETHPRRATVVRLAQLATFAFAQVIAFVLAGLDRASPWVVVLPAACMFGVELVGLARLRIAGGRPSSG